jgi:hypothetical protein
MPQYQDTVVGSIASQNIGAIGPRRLTANAIAERQRLISMSARGSLPISNTFELIIKWKLVKEEEEKQQQKMKVRWTVPTAPPTVMNGTGRPIVLAHRCGHIKALYHSQVEQIGVRPGNLGTSWFGFLSLTIN